MKIYLGPFFEVRITEGKPKWIDGALKCVLQDNDIILLVPNECRNPTRNFEETNSDVWNEIQQFEMIEDVVWMKTNFYRDYRRLIDSYDDWNVRRSWGLIIQKVE